MSYDVNDTVTLTATNVDSNGNAIDSGTAPTVTVTLPDQTTTSPSVNHVATGMWTASYVTTQAGRHVAYWAGTGANAFGFTQTFDVEPNTGDLISLSDLKDYLAIGNTNFDDQLRYPIAGITKVIEFIVGPIVPRSLDEWYDGGYHQIVLNQNPVLAISAVTETFGANVIRDLTNQPLDGVTPVDAYGYTVDLESGTLTRRVSGIAQPFAFGRRNVHVTYTAGRSIVDANIRMAGLDLARINFQPRLGGNRSGNVAVDQAGDPGSIMFGYFIPNRVMQQLSPSVHSWGIA